MKRTLEIRPTARHMLGFALAATLALPLSALAAPISLASEPLTTTTASNVKPNVMFILDDSGTMGYNYLPDWADDSHPVTGTGYSSMPELFTNNGFNGVAYNPAITYKPPVYYNAAGALDTTTYPSYSTYGFVKNDGYGVLTTSTSNLVGNASYYTFVTGEYCSTVKKNVCTTSAVPTGIYVIPAGLRWCNSAALTTCQSINNTTYKYPRYPKPATATVKVTLSTAANTVTQITVNGLRIMNAAAVGSTTESTTATNIRNAINACTTLPVGLCQVAGYSATSSGTTVTITAPDGSGNITYMPVVSGGATTTKTAFAGGVPGFNVYTNVVLPTTTTYVYPGTAAKAPTRTDCNTGTTCTYAQEMTNYANWWAYYHTRTQAMKTSVSRAFKTLNQNYRVGFSTLCNTNATTGTGFLSNDTFELAQKNNWFNKLFSTGTGCYTPLRGALSKIGRYYAHIVGNVDPVQYSCQQNFAILSTDGYWNTGGTSAGKEIAGSYGPIRLNGSPVGDQDNVAPSSYPSDGMYQGPTATSNTLADVAKYYYETDLRTTALGNCTGGSSPDGTLDVCPNNVFTSATDTQVQQHMTTFTMGLGADGMLNFQTDYDTASSGDFYSIKNGLGVNWPSPAADLPSAIDDLWHAAVNGRGTYFSAKDPDQIIAGFTNALSSITAKLGSAAAAATSTLNPVAGNNFAYLASYTTVKWTGNLEARDIDPATGAVSNTAAWCVENILQDTCLAANKQEVPAGSGFWFCVVPGATAATCTDPGSVYDAAALPSPTCTTEIANACIGTMTRPPTASPVVDATTDTRTIYTANNAGNALVLFNSAYATANPKYFNPSSAAPPGPVDGLTQWAAISAQHTPDKLIRYLRGQIGNDMSAASAVDRLYRQRGTVMGDTLESQPAFISNPVFNYSYPGYADFKTNNTGRKGTVFVGSNDGMLHAFVGADYPTGAPVLPEVGGRERWAYVPSMVIPNMWKLADTGYSTSHKNYVNGSPVIADICVSSCTTASAIWKTILVGGLNGGGRGYYALDITAPESPALLWEFTTSAGSGTVKDDDLGYTYGRPVIAVKADGTWVVVVTSGYNNISPGTGGGFLFVLNAATGAKISKIQTGVGSIADPSGLAQVTIWNDSVVGNQAGKAYATDLQGNIWRFNIDNNDGVSTDGVSAVFGPGGKMRFATLISGGAAQPITTAPVLGLVNGNRVIIVGTGKYLEAGDLTNKQQQTLYALKDFGDSATLINNPRSLTAASPKMVPQTVTTVGNTRTGSKNPIDFSTDLGWFVDLPDILSTGSERVNVIPKLVQGTLIVPTIVPSSTVCSPGGYGWYNFFDYSNGWPVDGGIGNVNVSIKSDSPIVGINILYHEGLPYGVGVTSNGDIKKVPGLVFGQPKNGRFSSHRTVWRELMQ